MNTIGTLHPAHALLLEAFEPSAGAEIVVVEGGDGSLAQLIAEEHGVAPPLTLDRDIRRLAEARRRGLPVGESVAPVESCNVVLLSIPKGRAYARMLLAAAWSALRVGGVLYLAGPSRLGAKSVVKDAQSVFGNAETLAYKHHQRVARCVRIERESDDLPGWMHEPGIAPGTTHDFEVATRTGVIHAVTRPGIFSWDGLDEGTALLLEHMQVEPDAHVADVGCGCGILGLAAAKAGARRVTMTDIDLLALDCARRSVAANKLGQRVEVVACDLLETGEDPPAVFDLIVSNPTFHTGHHQNTDMADRLIVAARDRLGPGGRLVIVANRFLSYGRTLARHGWSVRTAAEDGRYVLYEGRPT